MKVKDLIEILKNFEENTDIYIYNIDDNICYPLVHYGVKNADNSLCLISNKIKGISE